MSSSIAETLARVLASPRVASILYDGRSGSVFLQSLLDNHPEVTTMPATVLIGGVSGTHINYYLDSPSGTYSWETVAETFPVRFPTLFDSTYDVSGCRLDELGPQQNESIQVDTSIFRKFLLEGTVGITCGPKEIFAAIHLAWEASRGRHFSGNPVIVHATHTPEPLMFPFCRAFPEAQHLIMTRLPLGTYASHFNHHINKDEVYTPEKSFWLNGANADYALAIIRNAIVSYRVIAEQVKPSNIRAVRLEDLHANPRAAMQRVCDWLQIGFHDCLLQSTFAGKTHWGDVTIGLKTGPAYAPMKFDWQKDYLWSDVILFEKMFMNRMVRYGYESLSPTKKIADPVFEQLALMPIRWEARCWSGISGIDEFNAYAVLTAALRTTHPPEGRIKKLLKRSFLRSQPSSHQSVAGALDIAEELIGPFHSMIEAIRQRQSLCLQHMRSSESEIVIPLI